MTQRILCLGGAVIDRKYRGHAALRMATSNPVEGQQSFGGVARNVTENLARLGAPVALATLVGADENGAALIRHLAALGADASLIRRAPEHRTAEYIAVLESDGRLLIGLADMAIFDALTPAWLDSLSPHLEAAAWVFADCNLPADTLAALLRRRRTGDFRLAIDAVSAPKAARLPRELTGTDLLFLNGDEAAALLALEDPAPGPAAAGLRAAGAVNVVLTRGAEGCLLASQDGCTYLPARTRSCIDVTGAGDALIAGCLWRLLSDAHLADAVQTGMHAAALTIACTASVRPDLSPDLLSMVEEAHEP